MPHAEVTLPGAVSSVPTARRFVESILTAWGGTDVAWTATLLASELATNCALHAGTEFALRVTLESGAVRLEVTDRSPRLPQPRAFRSQATTGRGLQLVAALAESWGVEPLVDGKTVWARLAPSPADPDALLAAFDDDLTGATGVATHS